MSKIKFGIVGCGRIAKRHAEHINKLAELTAVCDVDGEKAQAFKDQYLCLSFERIEEFLETGEIDVVVVCTPNGSHAAQTIRSLEAGFHVLCEKPMATKTHDCEEMIKAAERNNKQLFIVKQNRFNPAVAAVKQKLDSGALGSIYSVQLNCFWNRNTDYYQSSDWRGTKQLDGGTLFTQFSHFIDLLYWMIGDVDKVYAFVSNFAHRGLIAFEDTGAVILHFKNGAIGTINYTVNAFARNMEGSITLFCEKGTVKIGGQYLNKLEYQSLKAGKINVLPKGNPANDYGEYQGSMSNHNLVYENVIEVLTGTGSIAANGLDGLKAVEIIEKIHRSINA